LLIPEHTRNLEKILNMKWGFEPPHLLGRPVLHGCSTERVIKPSSRQLHTVCEIRRMSNPTTAFTLSGLHCPQSALKMPRLKIRQLNAGDRPHPYSGDDTPKTL